MASGDDNTKKIQDFEKGRKQQNMIWELRNDNNQQVSTFEEIADIEKIFFFENLFKEKQHASIAEVIEI